jgi:hypothetical protein
MYNQTTDLVLLPISNIMLVQYWKQLNPVSFNIYIQTEAQDYFLKSPNKNEFIQF